MELFDVMCSVLFHKFNTDRFGLHVNPFVYGLPNIAVSNAEYVASNDMMIVDCNGVRLSL